MARRQRHISIALALAVGVMLHAGCGSPACGPSGTCGTDEPCTASSECLSGLCAPAVLGAASVCLQPCGPSSPCPSGQVCSAIGSGQFCERGTATDAGLDGGTTLDSGPLDGDGDGVPASIDCDDSNPAIGTTGERPCESVCAAGTELCSMGTWGACSAGTDCVCSMEGATRAAACGNCGNEMQNCMSGRWTATSDCIGQGCMPGMVETERTERCFERQRICSDACEWSDWETTHPPGECRPGTCFDGDLCNEECMYEPSPTC